MYSAALQFIINLVQVPLKGLNLKTQMEMDTAPGHGRYLYDIPPFAREKGKLLKVKFINNLLEVDKNDNK